MFSIIHPHDNALHSNVFFSVMSGYCFNGIKAIVVGVWKMQITGAIKQQCQWNAAVLVQKAAST